MIKDAENAGEVLLASAGAQIATAIEYAKTAYISALDTTIDKLTALEKKVIDDITTEISYVEHHVIDQLRQIVERGSLALNSLPFSNHFPQVGWYSPSYVAPTQDELAVTFNGNFFDSARKEYQPTVKVDGQTFTARVKTTLRLEFATPVEILHPATNDIVHVDIELSVPYRKAVLGGIFDQRKVATFSVSVVFAT